LLCGNIALNGFQELQAYEHDTHDVGPFCCRRRAHWFHIARTVVSDAAGIDGCAVTWHARRRLGDLLGWLHIAGRRLRDRQGRARENGVQLVAECFHRACRLTVHPGQLGARKQRPGKALTHSGHNWVFDQGSTLCKMTDLGSGSAVATGWAIPPNNPTDCVILPIIKNGTVTNLGDIPFQGSVITPTCDPTILSTHAPNPANTYFNQLGCAISHGKATTPQNATSWMFVAGVKGGMFSVRLDNVTNPVKGGEAGKTVGPQNYYSAIPEGSKLTSAAVNANGRFAIATSSKRLQAVYACFNPLGDPGDWTKPINPNFFVPPASQVPCMQVGSNNLPQDSTTDFGPDGQPYFGGRRVIMSSTASLAEHPGPRGPTASIRTVASSGQRSIRHSRTH
jgi:hypothetical protein